jgi:hypothetical protein
MSSRINNNNQSAVKKSYCKVCHDAGKPESVYTSHYVRSLPDRTGKTVVTCPTLLDTECRFCHKNGHTTKFCPIIASNKKSDEKTERHIKHQQETKKETTKHQQSKATGFTALYIDSDSDDDHDDHEKPVKQNVDKKVSIIVDEFPALCPVKTFKPIITGYAAAIAMNPAIVLRYKNEQEFTERLRRPILNELLPMKKKTEVQVQVKKSWADWSDSSDGDDDDYDEEYKYKEFPSFLDQEPQFYSDYA